MENSICVFGDSITYGLNDRENGGWVGRLQTWFSENPPGAYVYNLGICGASSTDLISRFRTECKARKANVILFHIGINDSQYAIDKSSPRTSLIQFEENLYTLINDAKEFSDQIVFLGLLPIDESKTIYPPWNEAVCYCEENVSLYDAMIKKVSELEHVHFLDLQNTIIKADLPDGVHPCGEGHEKIFQRVKEFLLQEEIAFN